MATKRVLEDTDNISDRLEGKRVRRWPSFTVVIKRAVEVERIKIAYRALFREVMKEEMEQWFPHLASLLQRSPQMLIEEPKPPSALQLVFKEQPSHTIFTEHKIKGVDGVPLQILLKETPTGAGPTIALPSSIKLEIVVLDGDFPQDESKNWSSSEFNRYVVKAREDKKPLLIGTTAVTLKHGVADIDELKFSDNSSWTKSKKFRIGVRVSSEHQQSLNIREAVSNPIKVKDRHGEVYMKHNTPSPNDNVWRLVNIAKNGVYHKKLVEKNINTVQDFMKFLATGDSAEQLRKIVGMPERKWEATISQARNCLSGEDIYIHNPPLYNHLNRNCDVRNSFIDGDLMTQQEHDMPMTETRLGTSYCWNGLEGIRFSPHVETQHNGLFNDGDFMPNNELIMGVEILSQEDVQQFFNGRPDKQTRRG